MPVGTRVQRDDGNMHSLVERVLGTVRADDEMNHYIWWDDTV